MTTTLSKVLMSSATYFALCATVAACPGGGNRPSPYPSNPSYPSYPSPYSNVNNGPVGPVTSNLSGPVSTAPQARLSVVPTTTTTTAATESTAPVGRLQLASPVSTATESKPVVDPKTAVKPEADPSVALDTAASAKETSKIADAIKGLVGKWMAVSRKGDGELSTVELQLDSSGWAKLTVPGADGKPSTTTRKVEFENSELKLTGADADVMLGKLVEFNSRQMVLERSGGQVTFVRP